MTQPDPSPTTEPGALGPPDEIRPGAWFGPDHQMVVSDELVRGLRFAHHVTQRDLETGRLEVVPDFAAIAAFAHQAALASGGHVDVIELGPTEMAPGQLSNLVMRGPEGWLAGGTAGDIVLLALDGKELDVSWAPPLRQIEFDSTPIAGTYEQLGNGDPVPLLDLVLHLLVDQRALFEGDRPIPLRDLLLASGLDIDGTVVVRASIRPTRPSTTDQAAPSPLSGALAAERLLSGALAAAGGHGLPDQAIPALADPDAVATVAEQLVGGGLVTVEQMGTLVDRLDEVTTPAAAEGIAFLRSRLEEWRGDDAQEATLGPLVATARQPAALVDAAWFAADRGDARGALALLRGAGVPADDPDLQITSRYAAAGPRSVGRNDPCWCGSGRKHKQCCLRLNGHDLASRAAWLQAKAVTYLQRPPQRSALLGIATASAGLTTPDEDPARVIAAACDALVTEICLFEGGVFASFVDRRGALLPDDELALAHEWAKDRHRVWEVADTGLRDPDSGTVRDLDGPSRAKIPSEGWILAVVHEGPLAIPGPATTIDAALIDEVRTSLTDGDPSRLAALVGRELGWTPAPGVGSSADPAPGTLAPTP